MLRHCRSALPEQIRPPMAAATAGLFMVGLFAVSQGRVPLLQRFATLLVVLVRDGLLAFGWLLSAVGWGWPVARVVLPSSRKMLMAQVAFGVGALLILDWLLAWAGWMTPWTAWGLGLAGWLLLMAQGRRGRCRFDPSEMWPGPRWPTLVVVAPVALLIGACTVAPGVLWSGENRGYDVLEYHLQLPREWLERGAMIALPHNAYSYLPNLFETAFLHLGQWRGSMLDVCHAAQLLHAAMALLTAAAIAEIVRCGVRNSYRPMPLSGATGSEVALPGAPFAVIAGIYLAVPWTIVTGSMAYNEQAVMAFGAVAMMVSLEGDRWDEEGFPHFRRGVAVGLLCGLATLCKLSAVGMIAIPVAVMLVIQSPGGWRTRAARAGGFAMAFGMVVGLWGLRNFTWTGNPLFPMAMQWLGAGHWTEQQAQRFAEHLAPTLPLVQRIQRLLSSDFGLAHQQFGYLVWPAALLGAAIGLRRRAYRRYTAAVLVMTAVQLSFWLFFTHLQSRFLIPLLLPASMLIGSAIEAVRFRGMAMGMATGLVFWLTALGYGQYYTKDGQAALFIDGVPLYRDWVEPYRTVNALPPGSKVYSEGFSTPFYVVTPMTYHTVWDSSPLGPALRRGGPAEAARWLRREGYSHALIDWGMLGRWMKAGNYGYDPSISPESLQALARDELIWLGQWSTVTLYSLRPGAAAKRGERLLELRREAGGEAED